MKKIKDVCYEKHPSEPKPDEQVVKFKLEEDPEAEKKIKLEGMKTNDLLDACFQGIDLKTYDGDAFSRTFLVTALNSAIDTAEMTFDISLTTKEIEDEFHDIDQGYFNNYAYTPLNVRPVQEIHSVKYYFGNSKIMDVPKNWIQKHSNSLTIFPISGAMSAQFQTGGYFLPFMYNSNYLPSAITVSYRAGLKKEEIPTNLLEYIYKLAANSIFEVWGDQIIGAGIASASLSIDGLSQSTGTTQSAMYGGASARIKEYGEDIDALVPVIRRYFSRWNMAVL